jgi:germination protein M
MVLLVALLMGLMNGCGTDEEPGSLDVYYINALGDGITAETYVPQASDTQELMEELLQQLREDPDNVAYRRTIPEDVEVTDTHLDEGSLSLYFNREYADLSGYTEVLIRAAIVKTLLQIDGINSVSFYVSDAPLQDSAGNLVGSMTADMFIDDYGNETRSLAMTKLTLYFSSADGKSLVKEEQDVYYNKNVAMERLIIEYLLKGPTQSDALAVIPTGTKVLNVTITDGVCYVNFDSTFLQQTGGVSSDVVLNAIVDSLTELDTINKVQILVNGETTMPESTWSFQLGTSYERDTSLVIVRDEEGEY